MQQHNLMPQFLSFSSNQVVQFGMLSVVGCIMRSNEQPESVLERNKMRRRTHSVKQYEISDHLILKTDIEFPTSFEIASRRLHSILLAVPLHVMVFYLNKLS